MDFTGKEEKKKVWKWECYEAQRKNDSGWLLPVATC